MLYVYTQQAMRTGHPPIQTNSRKLIMNKQKYRIWVVFCSFLFLPLSYAPLSYISLSYADVTPDQKAEYIRKAKSRLETVEAYQKYADKITEAMTSGSSEDGHRG